MRISNRLWFALLLLAGACTSEVQAPGGEYLHSNWAKNPLWDDGRAEVATYEAERIIYGKPRQFDYVYVLVKETFNEAFHVKTDRYDRDDLYEVMKVNKFCRIQTLAYPYHYLTSVFIRRDDPGRVHKLTNTSQEWCGNTAKSFLEKGDYYDFQYFSYWDGQGNGEARIDRGPWFEDQLSYTLRTLRFEAGLEFDVLLYPMQVTSQAIMPRAETATVLVAPADPGDLEGLEEFYGEGAWKVSVSRASGANLDFWFGASYPNYLLKMESADGQRLQLKRMERDAYWEHE